jgi:anthranilate phosphoribosyltransferase
MRLYNNVYQKIGIRYGIVNSIDGYDEISLTSDFKVTTNDYEKIYKPSDLGFALANPKDLYGGATKEDAVKIFDSVLSNTAQDDQKNVVIANAAFAIQVMEPKKSIEECIAIAKESIESGAAMKVLKKYIELNS